MPRRGSRTGKGSKSSKTARVLGLLTNPANIEEDASSQSPEAPRMDDKAAQAEIRSALEQELMGLVPAREEPVSPFAPAPEEPKETADAPKEDAAPKVDAAAPEPAEQPAKPARSRRTRARAAKPPAVPEPAENVSPEPAPAAPPTVSEWRPPVIEAEPAAEPPAAAPEPPAAKPSLTISASPAAEPENTADQSIPSRPASPAKPAAPAKQEPAPASAAEPVPAARPGPSDEKFICLNLVEAMVDDKAHKYMKLFGMCTCSRCQVDVKALALSNLPSKYVAVNNKDVVPLLSMYEGKYNTDVVSQVISACQKVMARPHHGR